MIGATIIAETDPSKLAGILSVEDLNNFTCLELDRLLSLDFDLVTGTGNVDWTEKEPVHFDEESGLSLFKVSEQGLLFVLGNGDKFNDGDIFDQTKQKDLVRLAEFVQVHGTKNIYVFETF